MQLQLQQQKQMAVVVVVLAICASTTSASVFFRKRELAPSLALDRLNALRDSIEKLHWMNQRVKCQLRGMGRTKRMVSPSMRLSELLDPLVQQPLASSASPAADASVEYADAVDPCLVPEDYVF